MKITIELSQEAIAFLDCESFTTRRNRSAIIEKMILDSLAISAPVEIEAEIVKKRGRPRKEKDAPVEVEIAPVTAGGGGAMPLPDYGSLSSALLDKPEEGEDGQKTYTLKLWNTDGVLVAEEAVYLDASKVEDSAAKWAAAKAAKLDPAGSAGFDVEIVKKED